MSDLRLLRMPAVRERVGLSNGRIYALIAAGDFPRPVKEGTRSLWVSTEIDAWIEGRIATRDMGQSMGQGRAA